MTRKRDREDWESAQTMEQVESAWEEASKTRTMEDIDSLGRLARVLSRRLTAASAELTRLRTVESTRKETPSYRRMDAEHIAEVIGSVGGRAEAPAERALLGIADLSVSLLRMIDSRRERGIPFDESWNEQELRRALAGLADQEFPPGPPMTQASTSVLDEAHDFQRYEHRTCRFKDGEAVRQLKVVCRCGWSSDWIDRDPDAEVAVSGAREMLAGHVDAAIQLAKGKP